MNNTMVLARHTMAMATAITTVRHEDMGEIAHHLRAHMRRNHHVATMIVEVVHHHLMRELHSGGKIVTATGVEVAHHP